MNKNQSGHNKAQRLITNPSNTTLKGKVYSKPSGTILQESRRFLTWLSDNTCEGAIRSSLMPILQYCDKLLVIMETRGKPEVIRYNKANRLDFLKFIFSLDEQFNVVGSHERFSKFLKPLARHIQTTKSYNLIRLYLSGLYITRGLRLASEPSFETIERKPSYDENFFDSFEGQMKMFLKNKLKLNPRHMYKPNKSLRFKEYHMTSKSGPAGHACWTSFRDIMNIPVDLKQAIYYLGGPRLESNMHKYFLLCKLLPEYFRRYAPRKGSISFRKISVINDKEGKTREVAIGDYFSQAALKPLHEYLFRMLRRIPQDCTHDQTKLLGKIVPTKGSSFHSIDLSSATDRFPLHVEKMLLKILFGPKYASCWKHIMVHHPFDYKSKNGTRQLRYATGNPMGMYSSWATFAVCHHFVVYLACLRARTKWETCPYMLLGDDIVIADDKVAFNYKEILREWDIPFSPDKTHTSLHGYEFAKQIIIHGVNVSPFPLAALFERRNSTIESVGIILQELWTKSWSVNTDQFLESYYLKIARWPKKRFLAFKLKLKLATSLLAYFKGRTNLGKVITLYVNAWTKKDWGKQLRPVIQKAFARWLAVKTVHKLFYESRDRVIDSSNHVPLGDLAVEYVMGITSLVEIEVDPFDFIKSVPFLQIYGRAEETFLKLNKNLNDKGLGGDLDIRKYIGKVDIPLSDRDFYVRHRDVLVIKALRSSKILEELIQTTPQVISWTGKLDFTLPWHSHCKFEGEMLPER